MVRNLPSITGHMVLIPWSRIRILCTVGQLSPHVAVSEPVQEIASAGKPKINQ